MAGFNIASSLRVKTSPVPDQFWYSWSLTDGYGRSVVSRFDMGFHDELLIRTSNADIGAFSIYA